MLANLKELKAKLGASPAEDEEKKPDSKPEPKPEQKTEPKQEPKPEASKPAAPPASAPAGEEGRNRTTTAMELAELEREQRELERDQAALEKEQKALEEAHAQHNQALVASAAKAITAPSVAPGKIEDELAAAIVALKPFTGQHEAINALFAGLELSPAAIDAIVGAHVTFSFLYISNAVSFSGGEGQGTDDRSSERRGVRQAA